MPSDQQQAEALMLRPITFKKYAQGRITSVNDTYQLEAESTRHCAAICRKQLVRSAFTVTSKITPVTKKMNSSSTTLETRVTYTVDCTFAKGDFTWEMSADGTSLYTEDMSDQPGYTLLDDGFFYKSYSNLLSEAQSRFACANEEATMASPYPRRQHDIVRQLSPNNSVVWLGMRKWFDLDTKTHLHNTWVTDGNDMLKATEPGSYPGQQWGPFEPSGASSIVATMNTTSGYWRVMTNTSSLGTRVCRRHKYYRRAPLNGKYYKMHYKSAPSFAAANDICRSEGGTLAIIRTRTSLDAVRGYRNYPSDAIYIAGTDAEQEGVFVMPDGSRLHAPNLTLDTNEKVVWGPGNPNGGTNENCLRILPDGMVYDGPCNISKKVLCEIQP